MKDSWPPTLLGNILAPVVRRVSTESTTEYRLLGVRLEGEGPFLRETKLGAQISASSLNEVKAGDFIYSRLFAWRGAFGIINDELDGCYVSNEFPLFRPINDQIDIRFLNYWFRLRSVINTVEADCSGSTPLTRNRYKEEFFLQLEIPLPPLSEQQWIVAKIEQLEAKIEEARGLRSTNTENAESLFISKRAQIISGALKIGKRAITEVADLERGKFSHRPRNEPRFFGGRHPWIQIGEIEAANKYILTWSQTLNDEGLAISKKFPKGTLLISIAATIGAVGILDFDCCIPDSIVAITPKQSTESEFMYHYLGYLRTHLEELAPQSAQKNINLRILSELPFPQIGIDEQRRIVAYLDGLQAQVDRLKALQTQTAAELAALLPSILDQAFKGEL